MATVRGMCDRVRDDRVPATGDERSYRRALADPDLLSADRRVGESGRDGSRYTWGYVPDGSVAETTLLQGLPLLSNAAVEAASRASFECRECKERSTPHIIAFVFSFDGFESAGNPRPAAWKQTGNANSEVTVFGRVTILHVGPPSKPFHVRAARCLWLWHCSKQAYVNAIH